MTQEPGHDTGPHVAGSGDHELIHRAQALAAELRNAVADRREAEEALRVAMDRSEDGSAGASEGRGARIAANGAPGERVGAYRLLERLGEGGFGIVFLAEQEQPVRRRVALKVIKPGMDTAEVIARFAAERQALALMNHEHIARVLDAGVTESGRPYFVMELVQGLPITEFCDKHRLSTTQRLELFRKVCAAVQHAHHKGVIHRDIKPSNVLVSFADDRPSPKVIDFGIAKAISSRLTDQTICTGLNRMIGTPVYMSPEQAESSALDVDTRTDVYSLGVLLFELLTGTTPLDNADLRARPYAEMQRLICDTDTPRPSTRLDDLGNRLDIVARDRGIDSQRLRLTLRGDLDWIVLKALEKDRQRRYQTVNDLSADIGRHLADLPVEAAAPSTRYRLGKFLRRHRRAAVVVALLALSLLAGMAGTTYGLVRAEQRRADAEAAQRQERVERQRAERRERETARIAAFHSRMLEEIDPAEAGVALVEDMIGALDASLRRRNVPDEERTLRVATLRGLLQEISPADAATNLLDGALLSPAQATIDREFADQPVVASALREALADVYLDLGRYAEAVTLQKAARTENALRLGDADPATLRSTRKLGYLFVKQGRYPDAEPLLRSALDGARTVLGPEHKETVEALGAIGALRRSQGRLDEASAHYADALAAHRRVATKDDPATLTLMGSAAMVLLEQERFAEAEPLLREVLDARRRVLGTDHRSTLTSMSNLGALLRRLGRLDEAEELYGEVLEKRRLLRGELHPQTLIAKGNMAVLRQQQGRRAEAEALHREVLAGRRLMLGDNHPDTMTAMANLGSFLTAQGTPAEAEPLLREAVERRQRVRGPEHQETMVAMTALAEALTAQGEFEEAERLLTACIETADRAPPRGRNTYRSMLTAMVTLYETWSAAASDPALREKAAPWKARLEAAGR